MTLSIMYRGYRIERGAFRDTTDDNRRRWYAYQDEADAIDRRGHGFATVELTKAAVDEVHALHALG